MHQLYAENIYQSELYNFVEVENCVFDEGSDIVVDPKAERLRKEFEGVHRSYIPLNAIIRIDEVERENQVGIASIVRKEENIIPFPLPLSTPNRKDPAE